MRPAVKLWLGARLGAVRRSAVGRILVGRSGDPLAWVRRVFLLLALSPVVTAGMLAQREWRARWHHAESLLGAEASLVAISAQDSLRRLDTVLALGAARMEARPGRSAMAGAEATLLRQLAGQAGRSAVLGLVASDGTVLAGSPGFRLPSGAASRAAFGRDLARAAGRDGTAIGTPEGRDRQTMFPVVRAVRSEGGAPRYLVAFVSFDHLLAKWRRAVIGPKASAGPGEAIVIVGNGARLFGRWPPVARRTAEQYYGRSLTGPMARALAASPERSMGVYQGVTELDGVDRIGRWRRLAGYPMAIGVSVPMRRVQEEWLARLVPLAVGLGFALGFLLLAYIVIARGMRRRVAAARLDELTGLPNRRGLFEYLATLLDRNAAERTAGVAAIIVLDLDDFKPINDAYGHATGDAVLRALGSRLGKAVRPEDLVARLGGDEFAIVGRGLPDRSAVPALLDRLGEIIESPLGLPAGVTARLGCSFGAALFPGDGATESELLARADHALYVAKRTKATRPCPWVIYDRDLDPVGKRASVLGLLHRDRLELEYQPIVRLRDDAVVEVEALARLADGAALLRPGQFLPALNPADRLELAVAVARRSIHDLQSWTAKGLGQFNVGINVERDVFVLPEFQQELERIVSGHGINPGRVTIEMLESNEFRSIDLTKVEIQRLRTLGVRISLDDLGAGYSSLMLLKELPIDQVKLDQSFIADLVRRPDDVAFVVAVQMVTRTLQIQLVVEGVEQPRTLEALRVLGVDCAQGYLLARPMSAAKMEDWLAGRPEACGRTFDGPRQAGESDRGDAAASGRSQRRSAPGRRLGGETETLFGAYVAHLLNRSVWSISPDILSRVPHLQDPHRCYLGRFLDVHDLHETELGEVHKHYHRLLGAGEIESDAFRSLTRRLSHLISAAMAADDAIGLLARHPER